MKILKFILIISFFSATCCQTQKKVESKIVQQEAQQEIQDLSITMEMDYFELDKFDNVYVVNQNQLQRLASKTESAYIFEDERYGKITTIDVSNPQKLLLFYDAYDIILSLDNTLTITREIDLKNLNYSDINAVALSNDNLIWLYDPTSFQLKKIDQNGQIKAESLSLIHENLDHILPIKIIEHENKVFVNSPDDGILVFDNLGQFIKLLPLKNIQDFQIKKDNLIFFTNRGAFMYSTKRLAKFQIEAIDETQKEHWQQVRVGRDQYYLGFKSGIKLRRK